MAEPRTLDREDARRPSEHEQPRVGVGAVSEGGGKADWKLPEVKIPGHQHRDIRYIDGSCVECGPLMRRSSDRPSPQRASMA